MTGTGEKVQVCVSKCGSQRNFLNRRFALRTGIDGRVDEEVKKEGRCDDGKWVICENEAEVDVRKGKRRMEADVE